MWDFIHTEYKGPVGYGVTILIYSAVTAAVFALIIMVVIPLSMSLAHG